MLLLSLYNPKIHGLWCIDEEESGKYAVKQYQETMDEEEFRNNDSIVYQEEIEENESFNFPLESHLRDFIVKNIENFKIDDKRLQLYEDQSGNGVEYSTGVGRIDILAQNSDGDFVVFELKLLRGSDKTVGQLLRYMGWIKHEMAQEKNVFGVIVADKIDEKLRYAASMNPNIKLFEYKLKFDLDEVAIW